MPNRLPLDYQHATTRRPLRRSTVIRLVVGVAVLFIIGFFAMQQTVYVEVQVGTDPTYRCIGSARLAPWSDYRAYVKRCTAGVTARRFSCRYTVHRCFGLVLMTLGSVSHWGSDSGGLEEDKAHVGPSLSTRPSAEGK